MGDEISENLIAMEDSEAKQVTQGYDQESKPEKKKPDEATASDDE